ncbi:CGNR zinc finger domain-containing protein [Nonomuraea typhae]|uniref:CGNR zinc finger domain-containing protein n=1 Tax=Nonomuraea typhae TaxID=2603600 RepID=UPI001FE2A1DB|nr:CGNR zinc finger domain-containing protein [Nonomuraea typhae]
MEVHSTKAMAARAVALCEALLWGEPTPDSVAGVLRAHGEREPLRLSPADVRAMRSAATGLVEVLGAETPAKAALLLNAILADAAHPPRLTDHGGATTWHLHVDRADDGPWAEWFLASSAMAFAVLLADHQRVPGGLCASASCGRPFLHLGGGSPRRYCTARCATRERVAAHRATHT